jgi:glutathione synthase/RimK-type ligase-like ATP-grasp enzyme
MIDVLIVSSLSERYYYDAFVKICEHRGIHVGILDPEHFVETRGLLDVELDGLTPYGHIELVRLGDDANTTVQAPIENIRAAWYLRVNRKTRVRDIIDPQQRFIWNETLCAVHALLSVLPCPWINTFESLDRLASNKLLQQQHAHAAGLRTPKTRMSNDPEPVTTFANAHNGLLLKSIGYTSLDPQDELVLYSERFDLTEIAQSEAAIRACAIYAQEYISKKYEYRVMFIDGEILACRIDSQASRKTETDWRHYDFANVAHTATELPLDVRDQITAFMNAIGLRYGALDLIETPSGEFVFLEVNPSGQWEWISKLAGLPIADAIATMFERIIQRV